MHFRPILESVWYVPSAVCVQTVRDDFGELEHVKGYRFMSRGGRGDGVRMLAIRFHRVAGGTTCFGGH